MLIENAGRLVTGESLMKHVWPDVTVVESGLTRNISVLRKALDGGMPGAQVIETIPRRGYRFIADVQLETEIPDSALPWRAYSPMATFGIFLSGFPRPQLSGD